MEENNKYDRKNNKSDLREHDEEQYGEIRYRLDRRSRFKNGIIQYSFMIIIVILVSLVTSMIVSRRMYEDTITVDTDSNFSQILKKNLENFETNFYDRKMLREIYLETTSSIVGVSNNKEAFFSNSYDEVYSGVVMNTEGYILVPYDVVKDETAQVFIRTALDIDNVYEAEIIGKDLSTATAVIRVQNVSLKPPKFGDSNTAKVAQSVAAIGNPFGDRNAGVITFGVISSVNKVLTTVTEDNRQIKVFVMETDAVVNKGTNGGVLVNMYGDVLGISSSSLTQLFNGGFGAVITANEARSIVRSIINTGEVLVPYLGIVDGEVFDDVAVGAKAYYISKITPESTVDRAGFRPTDVIISIDGVAVETATTLDDYIKTKMVGDIVRIRYRRSNTILELDAVLYGTTID